MLLFLVDSTSGLVCVGMLLSLLTQHQLSIRMRTLLADQHNPQLFLGGEGGWGLAKLLSLMFDRKKRRD
jgi:hypothetical protein